MITTLLIFRRHAFEAKSSTKDSIFCVFWNDLITNERVQGRHSELRIIQRKKENNYD